MTLKARKDGGTYHSHYWLHQFSCECHRTHSVLLDNCPSTKLNHFNYRCPYFHHQKLDSVLYLY